MEELVKSMKVTLATVFSFYMKAQNYHWNVEGPDFFQYHELFGKLYADVYGSVDQMAEEIRALQSYAPSSYKRFADLSKVEDELKVPTCSTMVERLLADNDIVIECLNDSFKHAETHNKQGLMDFLANRIDQHNKWGWFLRSSKKED
ncbi:DNA starvation/stationary phase protection protein [Candidatus Thorarchaeota archaeon]|nr:MAG: DNA starvation/stationary phase protection protein [Candidatus Thorarchaeota archaeon]